MKRFISMFLVVFLFVSMCFVPNVKAEELGDVIEDVGENDTTDVVEEVNEEKGFLEEYLGVILASSSGTATALGTLLYFVIKALKKSKDMITKLEEDNKISKENAENLASIVSLISSYVNNTYDKINEYMANLGATEEQLELFKNNVTNTIKELETAYQVGELKNDKLCEIFKVALLNDVNLVGKSDVVEKLEGLFAEYEEIKSDN